MSGVKECGKSRAERMMNKARRELYDVIINSGESAADEKRKDEAWTVFDYANRQSAYLRSSCQCDECVAEKVLGNLSK